MQNPRSYSGAGIFSCRFIPLSLCCSQHRHAAPILPQKGFSLYRREDFPWLGWGFCLWLRQGAFPAHRARRFHREQAHRPYFTAGIQPQAGASGCRFRRLHRCTGLKPKSEYSCPLAPAERISLLLFCAWLFFCIRLWYPNGRIKPPTGPQGRRMNAHEIQ